MNIAEELQVRTKEALRKKEKETFAMAEEYVNQIRSDCRKAADEGKRRCIIKFTCSGDRLVALDAAIYQLIRQGMACRYHCYTENGGAGATIKEVCFMW